MGDAHRRQGLARPEPGYPEGLDFESGSAESRRENNPAQQESTITTDDDRTGQLISEVVSCFREERPSAEVTPQTDLFELLAIPNRSLAAVRLRLAVQARLGLVLPARGLDNVATVTELAAALARDGRPVPAGDFETITDPESLVELAEQGVPFNAGLGIRVESLHPEVRLRLPNRPGNQQHLGFLAIGGITAALEACAGIAISMHVDPSTYPLITPNIKLDVISALDHDMIAISSLAPDEAAKLRARLEKMGHAVYEHGAVGLNRDGKKAAKISCTFYLRKVADWTKIAPRAQ
jgi:acyl-coenzyme A thioesterase PaaI-like protein/acyl carrier protein